MIPHNKPTLDDAEQQAALRVLGSGWLAQGAEVEAFENELCEFLGLPSGHAVAVSSGTAALFLAMWVLGAKGKSVAIPVYACAALRNAVAMAQAKEMLLDVGTGSPNVDLDAAAQAAPDILVAPHMYGLPMDLSKCRLNVIEDCAQALGAKIGSLSAGLQGKAGIFSFYATKLITSGGQGGMVVSRDRQLVDQVRDYRQFDCRHDRLPRFNLQMTDLQAAVGRAQLEKLPAFLQRRAHLYGIYKNAGLDLLDADQTMQAPARYRAVLKTANPTGLIQALADNQIKAIVPIEDWELLGEAAQFPHAWQLTKTTVSLPLYPSLTDEQAEKIARIAREKS